MMTFKMLRTILLSGYFFIYLGAAIFFYIHNWEEVGDQSMYLGLAQGSDSLPEIYSSARAVSLHFLHPIYLYCIDLFIGIEFVGILNILILFIALNFYIRNKSILEHLAFFAIFLPSSAYIFSYLKEPILFAVILLLLGLIDRKRNLLALGLIYILFFYRFYWAAALALYLLSSKKYILSFVILLVIIFATSPSLFPYITNSISKISANPIELIRAFFIPLPALSFGGEVDYIEFAPLHSVSFVAKGIISLMLIFFAIIKFSLLCEFIKDQRVRMVLLMMIASSLAGLVGPRQVLLLQAVFWSALIGYCGRALYEKR